MARQGRKVLFAQPSRRLIDQTIRQEIMPLSPSYPVTPIHSDVSGNVVQTLVEHFQAPPMGGEIVFVTHAALLRLPYVEKAGDWLLIVDEVPTVDVFEELVLPETHSILTEFLELRPTGAAYGDLVGRDRGDLDRIARNDHRDQVFGMFAGFAHRVLSEHWSVHALQSSYESLMRGEKANGRLTTYSLLRPSIFEPFAATIIASACMEDTMLYRLWTAQGVEMVPMTGPISKSLRYQKHENGDRIVIGYFSDEDWSKTQRDRMVEIDGETVCVRDRLVPLISEVMGGQVFAWMGNKDLPDDLFGHLKGAVRLPNSPHGLNDFQHLHQVAVLSALNPPPAHFSFMTANGISPEDLRTSHYRTAVYQAVMRISIRDPQNQDPKLVVVMDRATADWLADLFPGSQVMAVDGLGAVMRKGRPGRPRAHKDGADRVRAHRLRQRELWLAELAGINGSDVVPAGYGDFISSRDISDASQDSCNANTSIRTFRYNNFGTAFSNKHTSRPELALDLDDDEAFIDLLQSLHGEVAQSKEDNILLSPAHFDPDLPGTETSRGLANITHVRGIWMDNDGGDLTHKEFARLFPYLRIVVWNTYSSKPDLPRWRAFLPTSHAMSVAVHRCIMAQIEQVLRNAGYRSKSDIEKLKAQGKSNKAWRCHGFDVSKFNSSSLFYAPCRAAHPEGSFFVDYADPKRSALDLHSWLENCILDLRPEPEPEPAKPVEPPATTTSVPSLHDTCSASLRAIADKLRETQARHDQQKREVRIARAIETWRLAPPGTGHDAFFRLAAALKRAGLKDNEIEWRLREEAYAGHSPKDRRNEIRGIMRSLNRVGRF
ncbi:hypothetical protein [Prosthecomicrobium hirschii]|uniref:hypothetical protein n=1 Tax=Prosthecodimorpha hirschii TaxID=665126 RepID=UPI002220895E|nr:hypothetical protein [Prosthecomicrobium hirschii]MCW1841580.1 hypothetical protein [Prosthecomicrobium hirschii]